MQLKANLHFHSSEDPLDGNPISYTFYQAIDEAARLGFEVLAITLHGRYGYTVELGRYAEEKGILLIPAIEQYVGGKHVLILNCTRDAEDIETFEQLASYKQLHPEIFVVAPHPFFPGHFCLKGDLRRHYQLFDAIELSWFFTPLINFNRPAQSFARAYDLPLLATSDTHNLRYLNNSYAIIEATEKTIPAVIAALRQRAITNTLKPARFWRDMVGHVFLWRIAMYPGIFLLGSKILKSRRLKQQR